MRCVLILRQKPNGTSTLNPQVKTLIQMHTKGDIFLSKSDIDNLLRYDEARSLLETPQPTHEEIRLADAEKELDLDKRSIAKKVVESLRKNQRIKRFKDICSEKTKPSAWYGKSFDIYIMMPKLKSADLFRYFLKNGKYPRSIWLEDTINARNPEFSLHFSSLNQDFLLNNSIIASSAKSLEDYINNIVDDKWVEAQSTWYKDLPLHDLCRLVGYTYTGDILANSYQRGTLNMSSLKESFGKFRSTENKFHPLFYDMIEEAALHGPECLVSPTLTIPAVSTSPVSELHMTLRSKKLTESVKYNIILNIGKLYKEYFLINVVGRYVANLQRIISSSPPLQKMMVVYRGVKTDHFLNASHASLVKTDGLDYYQNVGFVSTSLNTKAAYEFIDLSSKKSNMCCLQRITILPGSHCILLQPISIYPEEVEVLLGNNTLYYIRKKSEEKVKMPTDSRDICSPHTKGVKVGVSDIVVVR
jgi:hypothetical protein